MVKMTSASVALDTSYPESIRFTQNRAPLTQWYRPNPLPLEPPQITKLAGLESFFREFQNDTGVAHSEQAIRR